MLFTVKLKFNQTMRTLASKIKAMFIHRLFLERDLKVRKKRITSNFSPFIILRFLGWPDPICRGGEKVGFLPRIYLSSRTANGAGILMPYPLCFPAGLSLSSVRSEAQAEHQALDIRGRSFSGTIPLLPVSGSSGPFVRA